MKLQKIFLLLLFLAVTTITPASSFALGECGLACCLAGANSSGVTNAENFGFSILHERMEMETILDGSKEVVYKKVAEDNITGMSYTVPTWMSMKKTTLVLSKPITERFILTGYVPYVKNNMDMSMFNGMMHMPMYMDEISGLGDVTVVGIYNAYTDAPVRPEKRVTLGFGIKAPTGEYKVKKSNGSPVHAMMQPGSGSWDLIAMGDFMRAFSLLTLRATVLYQYMGENDEGFSFGDQFSVDLNAVYNVSSYLNVGLEAQYIKTDKDSDPKSYYSNPAMSMLDNVDNTGLESILGGVRFQYKVPNAPVSYDVLIQRPLEQDVNGTQQVMDERTIISVTAIF